MYRYVIHGPMRIKKNTHRARSSGGRLYVGNTRAYRDWETDAVLELRCQRGAVPTIEKPTEMLIEIDVYLGSGQRRPDDDNALGGIFDALEGAGIVENDRQLKIRRIDFHRDRDDPRVEIWIRYK